MPEGPRMAKVTAASRSVGLGLTWMVLAPASIAMWVKEAAGCTSEEVPQVMKTSHWLADSRADPHACSGRASPNQTTPGRILAPHVAHRGGSSLAPPGGRSGIASA